MKAFRGITAALVLGFSSTLFAGGLGGVTVSHFEPLQRLSLQTPNTEYSQMLEGSGPASLSFNPTPVFYHRLLVLLCQTAWASSVANSLATRIPGHVSLSTRVNQEASYSMAKNYMRLRRRATASYRHPHPSFIDLQIHTYNPAP
jgi:hypothetical protein